VAEPNDEAAITPRAADNFCEHLVRQTAEEICQSLGLRCEESERLARVRSHIREFLQSVFRLQGAPFDPDDLTELMRMHHDFIERAVCPALGQAAEGDAARVIEKILWVMLKKAARFQRGGSLTAAEQARVAALFVKYQEEVYRRVCKQLRELTVVRTSASQSQVAASVWESFQDRHLDEIDLGVEKDEKGEKDAVKLLLDTANRHIDEIDLGDEKDKKKKKEKKEKDAVKLLLDAADRHCNRWNRSATSHKQVSLDGMIPGNRETDRSSELNPADTRESMPEEAVLVREISQLFEGLARPDQEAAGQLLAHGEAGLGLVRRLTPHERQVLGLKLARRSASQIMAQLGMSRYEVDYHWRQVQEKAAALDAA
jgi:DNA-binding CsgD family transcriptional regulator